MSEEIKNVQKSSGDRALNIVGNVYLGKVAQNASTEMLSIMKVISVLSVLSEGVADSREVSEKDIDKKLNNFSEFKEALKKEYSDLLPHYGSFYQEALKQSDISETTADKIAITLRRRSEEVLKESENNPITALSKLTAKLIEHFEALPIKEDYDEAAVRFYLFNELVKCNIFPNPLEL
ncbi:MAG: hypothetical protein LiPW15_331 [Parcubacteria group bacterium LiPW_15]|nr:MAG: hypothetical protein LiPW15_331 [Parcubacteria group bacterium LiPW_15]